MINTAVISAAGKGTRMKDLSATQPKHVIAVAERPFIFYLLDNLKQAGFNKLIVVVGYHKQVMIERLKKWQDLPIEIIDQAKYVPPDHYGTLCPIRAVEHLLGKESFVAVNGDNLYSSHDLEEIKKSDEVNYVAGLKHNHPEKYGVLISSANDYLKKIIEKPQTFVGNLINTGLYSFNPEIFSVISMVSISVRGEYELTDAINILALQDRVKIKKLRDYWLDFTKPEDIAQVEQFIKSGRL
ncbi:MAG: sugar phosphate nucleotidyltransferase [Patescibacteria group bacterium]